MPAQWVEQGGRGQRPQTLPLPVQPLPGPPTGAAGNATGAPAPRQAAAAKVQGAGGGASITPVITGGRKKYLAAACKGGIGLIPKLAGQPRKHLADANNALGHDAKTDLSGS